MLLREQTEQYEELNPVLCMFEMSVKHPKITKKLFTNSVKDLNSVISQMDFIEKKILIQKLNILYSGNF